MAWVTQLVLALMHLHTQPHCVLHRDIKQANVFLDGRIGVKLGDFGLARTLSSESNLAKTVWHRCAVRWLRWLRCRHAALRITCHPRCAWGSRTTIGATAGP